MHVFNVVEDQGLKSHLHIWDIEWKRTDFCTCCDRNNRAKLLYHCTRNRTNRKRSAVSPVHRFRQGLFLKVNENNTFPCIICSSNEWWWSKDWICDNLYRRYCCRICRMMHLHDLSSMKGHWELSRKHVKPTPYPLTTSHHRGGELLYCIAASIN